MSGPKCLTLIPPARLAALQKNRDLCEELAAAYSRLEYEANQLADRLNQTTSTGLKTADEARARAMLFLDQWLDDDAVASLKENILRAEAYLNTHRRKLENSLQNLQRRFRAAADGLQTLQREREELAGLASDGLPAEISDETRRELQAIAAPLRVPLTAPPLGPSGDGEEARARLAAADQFLQNERAAFTRLRETFDKKCADARARAIASKMKGVKKESAPSLVAVIKKVAAAPTPPPTMEKLDQLLAQVAVLQDTAGWHDLNERAAAIARERDAGRRTVLYENLVLDCDARLKHLREQQAWAKQVNGLLDASAPFHGPNVETIRAELRSLLRRGRPVPLDETRTSLTAAIEGEKLARERESKRRAILESLTELGYETREGMETALVRDGRLVAAKNGIDDYAIEVQANDDLSLVQTTMVRFAESDEMTSQQRLRDIERETAWCADHAAWRTLMAKRGFESNFKMQLPPGAHPVKVVVERHRSDVKREATMRRNP